MTTKEYVAAQDKWLRANNVHDGDKVKIFCIADDYECGWGDVWTDEMNGCLGPIGTVRIDKSSLESGIKVVFDDGDSWFFPYFVLDPTLKRCVITEEELAHVRRKEMISDNDVMNLLANWLSRYPDCPYGDDHECEFRREDQCWNIRSYHPECWINAAKEVLIMGYE